MGGLVSVILPTYNRARTLKRAVDSVLHQGYSNFELIIVDDASTDGTQELVATFTDSRISYVRLPNNGGASRARNEGLQRARGDYVAFQDSDDEWLDGKLQRQVDAARDAGGADEPVCVFHTKVMYVASGLPNNPKRNKIYCIPVLDSASQQRDFTREIHKGNIISPQTLLFTRATMKVVGLFDELLANCVDWDFAISLIYKTKVIFIDEPLVMTYLQSDSISILGRRGARSQLRISLKLQRNPDVARSAVAYHFSRIGWWISKLGNPRMGKRLLRRSLQLSPLDWKTWARFTAAQGVALRAAILQFRAR